MGMFDEVIAGPHVCDCGSEVSGWQTKSAYNALWKVRLDDPNLHDYYSYCGNCGTEVTYVRGADGEFALAPDGYRHMSVDWARFPEPEYIKQQRRRVSCWHECLSQAAEQTGAENMWWCLETRELAEQIFAKAWNSIADAPAVAASGEQL